MKEFLAAVIVYAVLSTAYSQGIAGGVPDFSGQYDGVLSENFSGICRVGGAADDCTSAPFTAEGAAKASTFDRAAYQESYASTCTVAHMPMVASPARYLMRLYQGEDLVTIYQQRTDTVRTIHMNAEPPLAELPHTRLGHSIGHWQGETLVIETTHVVGGTTDNLGFPYSDQSRITERYWREPGQNNLTLEVTLEDPVNYTEPFVLYKHELVWRPEFDWVAWNCSVLQP